MEAHKPEPEKMSVADAIIELMPLVGFTKEEGICIGIGRTLMEEFFTDRLERFLKIQKYFSDMDLSKLAMQILDAKKNESLDEKNDFVYIYNLLNRIHIHLVPHKRSEMFNGVIVTQSETRTIFDVTATNALKQKGHLDCVDSWPGIYKEKDVANYFHLLEMTAIKYSKDICFLANCLDHTIAFFYKYDIGKWDLVDSASEEEVVQTNISIQDISDHVKTVVFEDEENLCFETVVCALFPHEQEAALLEQNEIEHIFDEMKSTASFSNLHTVSLDLASLQDSQGYSLAILAAAYGYLDVITALVKLTSVAAFNINRPSKDGTTPLHFASQNGHTRVVLALLQAKADVGMLDQRGALPAHLCVLLRQNAVLEILIKSGTDVNAKNSIDGNTLLHHAAAHKYFDTICLLIKHGADVTLKNNNGKTIAHIAAEVGDVETMKKLLDLESASCCVVEDNMQLTPFYAALIGGRISILKILNRFASFNYYNTQQLPLLDVAKQAPNKEEVMDFLEEEAQSSPSKETFFAPRSPASPVIVVDKKRPKLNFL